MKRYLFLIFSILLVSCAHKSGAPDTQRYTQLVIVGTNDVHGYLRTKEEDFYGQKVLAGGAEWFAGYMRILEKKFGDHLILLDAGDIFQGTMESNSFHGRPMIAYYNLLPYRASAVGNHEFDYGPDLKTDADRLGALKARMSEAKFPFLAANIVKKSGQRWTEKNLMPHMMFSVEGINIGIFGLTTETAPQKTRPQNVKDLEFTSILETAKAEAAALRMAGADLVLFTSHEGGDNPGEPIYEMLNALPRGTIDAAVTGHTHTLIHKMIAGVPVIQSLTRGQFFGRIDLFVDKSSKRIDPSLTKIYEPTPICGTFFKDESNCNARAAKEALKKEASKLEHLVPLKAATFEGEVVKADQAVHNVLAPYIAKVSEIRLKPVAKAERDFISFPSGETETGNLLTDALRKAYPEARAVYYNGGGIRRNLQAGPITYGDMFEVMPFDNAVVQVKVKGIDLRHMVEIGVAGEQSLPALSGVKYEYFKSDNPRFERDLNGDGKKELWERNRLKSLTWDNGQPVKDEEEFWLVTNDFLLDGGDRMGFIFNKIPRSRVKIEDTALLDAVINQLPKFKNGLPYKSEPRVQIARE